MHSFVSRDRLTDGTFPHSVHRDAWKSVEGTPKEEAQAKYVEKLLEVRKAGALSPLGLALLRCFLSC